MRHYLRRINLFMSHDFSRISQHLDNVSKRLSSTFSLGIQMHPCDVVYRC